MPDKLTDSEIVKALECCRDIDIKCETCQLWTDSECTKVLYQATIDLINRLQAEKEELVGNNDRLKAELFDKTEQLKTAKVEIERLTAENKLLIDNDISNKYPNCVLVEKGRIYTRTLEDYDYLIGDISAEAVTEFADKISEIFLRYEFLHSHADCARKDYIKADDGTKIEMQSVWDVFTL